MAALASYLKIRGSLLGLFLLLNLIPVTVNAFHRFCKAILDMCQLSSSLSNRVVRVGATTLAFQIVASGVVVQRWAVELLGFSKLYSG